MKSAGSWSFLAAVAVAGLLLTTPLSCRAADGAGEAGVTAEPESPVQCTTVQPAAVAADCAGTGVERTANKTIGMRQGAGATQPGAELSDPSGALLEELVKKETDRPGAGL